MENYFTARRTRRSFTDRPVDDGLLSEIISKAAHAPTTGNMQLYSIIITRDADTRRALAGTHFNQPAAVNAPVLVTFCADFNRFSRWCAISGADAGYDNLQGLTTALLDTAIVAQQFNTVAELSGLGCCYLGTTTYNAPQIAEILHLPRLVVPVTTLAVGWPADTPADCGRLPVESYVHPDTYHDPSDEEIRSFYAEKEARPDSQGFVAENGKENLAQVFTDVRYPRSMMESFSTVWHDFLLAQGFSL